MARLKELFVKEIKPNLNKIKKIIGKKVKKKIKKNKLIIL